MNSLKNEWINFLEKKNTHQPQIRIIKADPAGTGPDQTQNRITKF